MELSIKEIFLIKKENLRMIFTTIILRGSRVNCWSLKRGKAEKYFESLSDEEKDKLLKDNYGDRENAIQSLSEKMIISDIQFEIEEGDNLISEFGEPKDHVNIFETTINYTQRIREATMDFKANKNNSIIISGHSDGKSVWGGDSKYPYISFYEIKDGLRSENIESVFFAGCSTGGIEALQSEMGIVGAIPPGRIYGINGASPTNSTKSANGLSNLMTIDDQIRNETNLKKIHRKLGKSLLKAHDPVLLLGLKCELYSVSKYNVELFDPDSNCGVSSQDLKNCFSRLYFGRSTRARVSETLMENCTFSDEPEIKGEKVLRSI